MEILKRETEVTSNIYLYEENGRWYAYENSAYLISQLLKDLVSIERVVHDTFLVLARVELEPEPEILVRCYIVSCSDTELMISFPDSMKQVA